VYPLLVALLLLRLLPGGALRVEIAIPATTALAQDAKPSSPEKPTSDPAQQPSVTPPVTVALTPPVKTADKPKKVITNDDLKGGAPGSGFSAADFSMINNCNRACFEQVRQQAHIIPSTSPNWKHELLQAVEQVRKDDDWQKYLRDLYEVRLKFCSLGNEKRDELARYTDPNNVTPRELAIDEKYDAKFIAAQNELRALDAREAALQRKYAGSSLAYQFMMIQASRIQSANCYSQNYAPTDAEDP
jgi:hypothetical protein